MFLTLLNLTVIKPLFKEAVLYVDATETSLQELEVLVIHHITVTIGNQDTTTFSDWIARVE